MDVVNIFKPISNRVIVYSTCELWNNVDGAINLNTPFDYNYSPYIKSKELLTNRIKDLRDYNQNVIIVYPFNFNSPYRKGEFLFGKIFDSIINKKKIEIGNTDFNRDLIHPRYIVERSIKAKEDEIIGSGYLINVNKFIKDLYKEMNMVYEDYVTENSINNLQVKRKEFYSETDIKYSYELLLSETVKDIKNYGNIK
jgi:GDP-D-mannose dehydratase